MRNLTIIIFLLTIFYSCKKRNINPGIIEQEINFGTCLPINLPQQEYVIQSNTEYQLLLNNSVCQSANFPNIDFSQYSLLGQYTSGKCKITFKRQVTKDEGNQRYNFTVHIFDRGICKKQGQSMNWVLVPKLPTNWTVNFEIKQ